MDAGWNASAKRYPGGKILVANLPNVEIGSTIEVEFEITATNRPFLAGFESFQLPDELASKSVALTAPTNVPVRRMISGADGGVKVSSQIVGGRQVFSWTAEKVPALPAETQLPPEWTYDSGVSFFIGDANDYYRELQRTLLDRSQKNSHAAALARQLFQWAKRDPKLKVIPAVERELIIQALKETGNNQVHAAKLLGITRATLRKRIEKFGIQRELNVK